MIMTLAWLTDLHLDLVELDIVDELCIDIRLSGAGAVLITGDIASAHSLPQYLQYLAANLQKPIYFVLGNHDYYGSSIEKVNIEVTEAVNASKYLVWLSEAGVVELSRNTCLIGHEGLADGRLGDPEGSQVILNDYLRIEELRQPTKQLRLDVQNRLGDTAAKYLKKQLDQAIGKYANIIVALHVPPFAEACWHLGRNTDAVYLPHFGCQATGDVLRAAMEKLPESSMTVFCGHTHSSGYAQILPNLRVFTAGAEYYHPCITDVIEI